MASVRGRWEVANPNPSGLRVNGLYSRILLSEACQKLPPVSFREEPHDHGLLRKLEAQKIETAIHRSDSQIIPALVASFGGKR